VIMGPALAVIDPRRPKTPRTAFMPLPRACVAPPMAATTVSPCSFRCSSTALISNFAQTGSGGCDYRAGTGCNRFRVSLNPRLAFAPSPVRVRILLSRFVSFIRREHLATCLRSSAFPARCHPFSSRVFPLAPCASAAADFLVSPAE